MGDKGHSPSDYLLALWLALLILFGLAVYERYSDGGSWVVPNCFFFTLIIGVAALVVRNMVKKIEFDSRIFKVVWLALFLLLGLWNLQQFISYWFRDETAGNSSWLGYLAIGVLTAGVVGLVTISKRIAGLGVIALTAYTGLFLMTVNYVLEPIIWDLTDVVSSDDSLVSHWIGYWIGSWLNNPDWIRTATYICLGYVVAKRKGLLWSVASSILIALMDSVLRWLGSIPSIYLDLGEFVRVLWPMIVGAILVQTSIYALLGLAGAIITRLRWSRYSQVDSDMAAT